MVGHQIPPGEIIGLHGSCDEFVTLFLGSKKTSQLSAHRSQKVMVDYIKKTWEKKTLKNHKKSSAISGDWSSPERQDRISRLRCHVSPGGSAGGSAWDQPRGKWDYETKELRLARLVWKSQRSGVIALNIGKKRIPTKQALIFVPSFPIGRSFTSSCIPKMKCHPGVFAMPCIPGQLDNPWSTVACATSVISNETIVTWSKNKWKITEVQNVQHPNGRS